MDDATLDSLFWKSKGGAVEFRGRTVSRIFHRTVQPQEAVTVRFIRSTSQPSQGLLFRLPGGTLRILNQSVKDLSLWSDTFPGEDTLVCETKRPNTLKIWNAWRSPDGKAIYWIHESGILIEEPSPATVVLRCSDGIGDADFDDLVVELEFRSEAA